MRCLTRAQHHFLILHHFGLPCSTGRMSKDGPHTGRMSKDGPHTGSGQAAHGELLAITQDDNENQPTDQQSNK